MDYTGTNTSNKSDANMEHSDSQGSNDTIKITQFPPHFKTKVRPSSQTDSVVVAAIIQGRIDTRRLIKEK